MILTKAELRTIYRKRRAELSSEEIQSLSLQIADQVTLFCGARPDMNHFHIFLPIDRLKEVNTYYIKEYLMGACKSLYTSTINPKSNEMEVVSLDHESLLEVNDLGISVPVSNQIVKGDILEVVFIPLLAIDIHGNRIGYGKGYYDRFLAGLNPTVLKIGLSFFKPIESIPAEAFDIRCDYVITPDNCINFSKK
jgi:5-formyltetrahydrofolate cyclo-ligase